MGKAIERLEKLEEAAQEWFAKERARLQAEEIFLKNLLQRRGGGVTVQDIALRTVGGVLIDSVSAYVGDVPYAEDKES